MASSSGALTRLEDSIVDIYIDTMLRSILVLLYSTNRIFTIC